MMRPVHDTIGVLVILAALVALLAAATAGRPQECRYGHPDASALECDHIMSGEQADSVYGPLLDSLRIASPEGDIVL